MVVARQQGLRSPYCARACVLYAEHLCRLIFLDGGASASVLDGLNAMHYIIHAVGAAAKPRAKQKTPTKIIAVDRDIKTSAVTAASKTSPAAGAGDASDEEVDWSSDDSLGDVDPALLKAAMLAVKMNLGDDNSDREADRQRPAAAAAMPAPASGQVPSAAAALSHAQVPAAAVAASVIPKFSVLPAKGMQEDTANKYLAEASGVVATVATVAVGAHSAPSTAVAGNATNPDGDDDAWSSDGSDDSFGDVDPAKLKAAMLAVKMNLGDDNPTAAAKPQRNDSFSQPVPVADCSAPTAAAPRIGAAAPSAPTSSSAGASNAAAPLAPSPLLPASPVAVSPCGPVADSLDVHTDIHVALLQLAICLMVDTTQGVCIRAPFASQRPEDDSVTNVAFLLSQHLSAKRNKMACVRLAHALACLGSSHHLRLLKLLSPFPSFPSTAGPMTRVGQGMFGTVRRRVFPLNFVVAVKELEAGQTAFRRDIQ